MTTKSLLLVATLALAGIASAKSYNITLSAPMKAGSVQLPAGEYSLKVQGSNAILHQPTEWQELHRCCERGDRRQEVRRDGRDLRHHGRQRPHYVRTTGRFNNQARIRRVSIHINPELTQ